MQFLDILAIFRLVVGQITSSSSLHKKAFATWMHAFLSSSIAFYHYFFAWACPEIKILSFWTRNWPTSFGTSFCFYFFTFPFSLLFFAAVIDLLLGLFPVQIYLWQSIIETGNFYHGVAMCSSGKFCSEFFTQISEHFQAYFRLHWADHSNLGIIGQIFPSCRSWV